MGFRSYILACSERGKASDLIRAFFCDVLLVRESSFLEEEAPNES